MIIPFIALLMLYGIVLALYVQAFRHLRQALARERKLKQFVDDGLAREQQLNALLKEGVARETDWATLREKALHKLLDTVPSREKGTVA